jgi:NADPH:quinone reductase-like Zn-dependent oxidoreductase
VFSGQLRPVIDSVYPLSEGPSALRRLQAGDVAGKILLKP